MAPPAGVRAEGRARFARLRERVADGRWEVLGGAWVEHETVMSSGESLARQWISDGTGI